MKTQPWSELVIAYDDQLAELEAARVRYQQANAAVLAEVVRVWRGVGWPAELGAPDVEKSADDGSAAAGRGYVKLTFHEDWGALTVWAWLARGWGGPSCTLRLGVLSEVSDDSDLPGRQIQDRVRAAAARLGSDAVGEPGDLGRMVDLSPGDWWRVASIPVSALALGDLRQVVNDTTIALIETVVRPVRTELEALCEPLRRACTAVIRVRAELAAGSMGKWSFEPEDEMLESWETSRCLNLSDDEDAVAWVGVDHVSRELFAGCRAGELPRLQRLASDLGREIEQDIEDSVRVVLAHIDDEDAKSLEAATRNAFAVWIYANESDE